MRPLLFAPLLLMVLTYPMQAQTRYPSYDEGWKLAHSQHRNLVVARQVPTGQLASLHQDATRKGYVFAVALDNDTRVKPGVTDFLFTQHAGVRVGAVSQRCFYRGVPYAAPAAADPLVLVALRQLLVGQDEILSLLRNRDSGRIILLPIVLRQQLEVLPQIEIPMGQPQLAPPSSCPCPPGTPCPPNCPGARSGPQPVLQGTPPISALPQPVGVEDPGPAAPYPQNYSVRRTLYPPR